jgi:preprotein translocase subunit SecA
VGQEIQQKTAEEAISYFESESQAAFEKLEKDLAVKAEENKMVPNDFFTRLMKNIILQSLDHYWIDYLSMLENLRKGIGLRAYGQHDPLMEYKRESYQKFKEFEIVVRKQIVYSIFRLNPNNQETSQQKSRRMIVTNANSAPLPTQPNIGRNDPCPCGSGKKYKKCHGA